MTSSIFEIGRRLVGCGQPCFVIAEAGVNHNGDASLAYQLIDAAAEAGADAVKFQTFRTDEVVTRDAPKATYQKETTSATESQRDMISKLELPPGIFKQLQTYATSKGLIFLSTPFDLFSVDVLAELDVPAFKIPSGEITHDKLLAHVASKGKPVILSTGMSNLNEVAEAVRCLRLNGARDLCILQCTSNYPTDPADVNLRAMTSLSEVFRVPVGLSDHTLGFEVAIAAVALGASLIEKHLTLNTKMPGPDHAASMEPNEFASMIVAIRKVEAALGDGIKRAALSEVGVSAVARRSLVAARNLSRGASLCADDVSIKRPGTGMPPAALQSLLGKTLRHNIEMGNLLTPSDFEP